MHRILPVALFGAAGVALVVINVWNNATQVNGGSFIWNDLTAVVIGLAAVGGLLSLSLGAIRHHSRSVAALCVVAILGCVATSVGYTLGRVGSVADSAAGDALAHNARIDAAQAEIRRLDAKIEAQGHVTARECRGYKPGRSDDRRWPNCTTALALVAQHRAALEAARARLVTLGARRVADPAGARIEAVTGGLIRADAYRTAHPVIVAATLELGCSLLLTIAGLFAASGRSRRQVIDITPVDPVVAALKGRRQPLTNRELARLAQVSEATASRSVAALVASGRATKVRDGRAQLIRLVEHAA